MRTPEPLISICVLTYNRCAVVQPLLHELSALEHGAVELIVVDNHSEDATQAMVRTRFPSIRYIRATENIGAAARNLGMKAARGQIVVGLDDDVSGLSGDHLRTLGAIFDGDPDVGAVNFRVTNDEGATCNWVHHCRAEEFDRTSFPTYEITEGAVAFRKAALERAGYYPDGFFLSHEGPDLAFRILEHGFKVVYSGAISVRHGFAPQGRQPWRNYYYDTRNQLWLAARNFPAPYAARYLARGLLATLIYALRDGYLRYWFKALVDGLCGTRQALRQRKVLSAATMRTLRQIDAQRPGIAYLLRKRLLARDGLLLK